MSRTRFSLLSNLGFLLALACAFAGDASAQAPAAGDGGRALIGQLFLFGSFILIFYFLFIRPQQKTQRELKKAIEALKKGDRVLTSGGMYGTVLGIKDDVIVLTISENTKAEFAKSAVTVVVSKSS